MAPVLRSIPACVLTVLSMPGFAQNTWYVDQDGVPPGTGTPADPYTSIQYAIEQPATVAGDLILVEDGVYAESLDYRFKEIAIRSLHGPARTILEPQSAIAVSMNGTTLDPNVLEGFWIRGSGEAVGVYGVFGSVAVLRKCILSGFGVGFVIDYNGWIESSTIAQNSQALSLGTVSITLAHNTIFWDNPGGVGCGGGPTFIANYCDGIDASCGSAGVGNFFADPLFWDAAGGDFALRPGSPCVDTGDPASAPDPDGSRIDVGAMTFDPEYAPEPTTYCTGKQNSLGCVGAIGSVGKASATSADPFFVDAQDVVPGKLGLLFYGHDQWALPWQGGFHCVLPPTRRTPAQVAGASGQGNCPGTYSFDFNGRIQSGVDPALVAGETVFCQYWHRDQQEPSGFGTGLTDALRFSIAP